MKKYLLYFLLCFASNLGAQSFSVHSNLSGRNLTQDDISEINASLDDIVQAFENKNIILKIVEYSNYNILEYATQNNLPWENVINEVSHENENFILIGRIYNRSEYPDIEIKARFNNNLECFDQAICAEIEKALKYSIINTLEQGIKESYISTFETYKNDFIQRIECCASRSDCEQHFTTNQTNILDELYEYGYVAYPVSILNPSFQNTNKINNNRNPCTVIDENTTPFSIGGTTNLNITSKLCSYSQDLNSKFYISDNKSYHTVFNQVKNDIRINNYELAGHFHIYDSADPDKIPDLILWKDYSNSYHTYFQRSNANSLATPFNFTENLPIISSDIVPNYPSFIDEIKAYAFGDEFMLKVDSRANQLSIPTGNITIYSFPTQIWQKVVNVLDPIGIYSSDWEYLQAFLIKEYPEENSIFAISTADCGSSTSKYFGFDASGNYVCNETQHGVDNIFYNENGKPYLDPEIIEKKGPETALMGKPGGKPLKWAKRFIKKKRNKGLIVKNSGYTIYEIIVQELKYIGSTTREVSGRMVNHVHDVAVKKKWEAKGIDVTKLTMKEIITKINVLIENIPNKKTLKGLEQFFIEADDLTVKGLNKINVIDPKRKAYFRSCLDEGIKFMKKNKDLKEQIEETKLAGRKIDDIYNQIVAKYGL